MYFYNNQNWPIFEWNSAKLMPLRSYVKNQQGKLIDKMGALGFEQDDMQAELDNIIKIADDYDKMTPEEEKKNTYTLEVPPKFEIFSDRLEITSYGGLFEGMTQDDFFDGLSLPRNKELMRIFKDLDMVEQLGSGVPRILQAYSKDCFKFSDNYLRMTFPLSVIENNQVSNQVKFTISSSQLLTQLGKVSRLFNTPKVKEQHRNIAKELSIEQCKVLEFTEKPKKRKEILEDCLELSNQTKNFNKYIIPLLDLNLIQRTLPDRPNSQHQKYFLTKEGKDVLYLLATEKLDD